MTLKLEAKTFEQIKESVLQSFKEYNENPNAPQPYNEQYITRKEMLWVPLKKAQKRDDARLSYIKILEDDLKSKKAKFTTANKILDEFPACWKLEHFTPWLNRMREALKDSPVTKR
jgi:hypothetical protein